jgi:undecaprenyl-diphosphatase
MQAMTLIQILILAVVQGLAEMLPVSSSAHVILVQKFMGLDPSAPEMTFLLVMLHTGTMIAALAYFGRRWRARFAHRGFLKAIVLATVCTGILGFGLKLGIEKGILKHLLGHSKGEVEELFNNLPLIGTSLLAAGILIIISSRISSRASSQAGNATDHDSKRQDARARRDTLGSRQATIIGIAQGFCLPFRGLSRSGTTISAGLLLGVERLFAEEFSFALAVVLTPPIVLLEFRRLTKSIKEQGGSLSSFDWIHVLQPGLLGMVFSFLAGLLALRLLSRMLEKGRWQYFGYYCIAFAAVVYGCAFM